jgi:hypothetical protein
MKDSLLGRFLTGLFNLNFDRGFGQAGVDVFSDTNAHNGKWMAVKADGSADAVFTTLTVERGDDLDGLTLVAGDIIYGPFTDIELTSGTVYAYRTNRQ